MPGQAGQLLGRDGLHALAATSAPAAAVGGFPEASLGAKHVRLIYCTAAWQADLGLRVISQSCFGGCRLLEPAAASASAVQQQACMHACLLVWKSFFFTKAFK
jgi:hypothetical protein